MQALMLNHYMNLEISVLCFARPIDCKWALQRLMRWTDKKAATPQKVVHKLQDDQPKEWDLILKFFI